MRVVATSLVAEHIGPLIELFTAREEGWRSRSSGLPGAAFAEALEHRRADIALGPSAGAERAAIASAPFLRCRLIIVAAPSHPLAGRRASRRAALAGERWLVGQPELDPTTGTGLFFARSGLVPDDVAAYSSQAPRQSRPRRRARASC